MRRVWNRLFDSTGFRGKTLWEWMGLLIVPLFIAGATLVFSIFELRREEQRVHTQQQIETDRAQQTILQSYMQDMTELLLDKGLATSDLTHPGRSIARSSTLAAVRQLDADRKGILLQFLYESNLIGTDIVPPGSEPAIDRIVYLNGADLSSANLSDASLRGADLRDADLRGANLRDADLRGANLFLAHLRGANLRDADLSNANLSATVRGGDDVPGAQNWTNEQLAQSESLVGAILADGTVMTEEAWEEFKKRYRQ